MVDLFYFRDLWWFIGVIPKYFLFANKSLLKKNFVVVENFFCDAVAH